MNKNQQISSSSVSSSCNLIDAKLEEHQLCGSNHCPGCGHKLEGKPDWVGLPAGVKFDPTDQELIEHLEAKVEGKESKSHPLIDEFIPTIEGEDGICYTHPEKLPGVTRDGLSRHFFHRPSKAYTTGTRKRRKIQTEECDIQGGETRWHKTGKTRPVMLNGKQKGCKKILVLYTNFGKNRKPEKTNWVMHQYHLGQHEEEKEGELVVSKIFYQTQPRQSNWSEKSNNPIIVPDQNITIGSVSSSSSKDMQNLTTHNTSDQLSLVAASSLVPSNFTSMENFRYLPFAKTFGQSGIGEASMAMEAAPVIMSEQRNMSEQQRMHQMTHDHQQQQQLHHHHQQQHHHHQIGATSFQINRPSHSISTIIAPPPLHHTSVNILDDDAYHVSRLLLQNDNFQEQEQEQEQQHHKIGGRSASGLEELIMGCTSTSTTDIKEQESAAGITNPQEPEWLKYSNFWPDPDHNPDHHG